MPDTLGSWEIIIYCESGSNIELCINKNEVKDRIECLMKVGKHRGRRTGGPYINNSKNYVEEAAWRNTSCSAPNSD